MAKFVLAADYNDRANLLRAGKVLDDTLFNVACMQADGAVVIAASASVLAKAARLQSVGRSGAVGEFAPLVDKVSTVELSSPGPTGQVLTSDGAGGWGSAPIPPAGSVLWIPVAAGATVAVAANAAYKEDSTGALVTNNLLSAPPNGTTAIFKLEGISVLNPTKIVAGAGDTVEDPQNAGTFSAVAGFVVLSTIGALFGVKYDSVAHQWALFL
jgi:hypothetical protein